MFKLSQLENALPGVATEEIQEGRVVVLAEHGTTYDFGARKDLPGFKLPDNTNELAAGGVFVAGQKMLQPDYQMPLYQPYPEIDWSLRMGFDKPDNTPFNTQVHLVPPSVAGGVPIPSGALMLGYQGAFTLHQDLFVSMIGVVPGAKLTAEVIGIDAGKFKVATTEPVIAVVLAVEDHPTEPATKEVVVKLV